MCNADQVVSNVQCCPSCQQCAVLTTGKMIFIHTLLITIIYYWYQTLNKHFQVNSNVFCYEAKAYQNILFLGKWYFHGMWWCDFEALQGILGRACLSLILKLDKCNIMSSWHQTNFFKARESEMEMWQWLWMVKYAHNIPIMWPIHIKNITKMYMVYFWRC